MMMSTEQQPTSSVLTSTIVQEKMDIMTTNVVNSSILGASSLFDDRLLRLLFENKDEFLAETPLSSPPPTSHHQRRSRRSNRSFAIERSLFDTALQSICEEDENCSQESTKEQQQQQQPKTQPRPQHLVPVYSH